MYRQEEKVMRDSKLTAGCFKCKRVVELNVNGADIERVYRHGAHVQDAMPYLTAGEREILISGLCERCFNEIFADSE